MLGKKGGGVGMYSEKQGARFKLFVAVCPSERVRQRMKVV